MKSFNFDLSVPFTQKVVIVQLVFVKSSLVKFSVPDENLKPYFFIWAEYKKIMRKKSVSFDLKNPLEPLEIRPEIIFQEESEYKSSIGEHSNIANNGEIKILWILKFDLLLAFG